MAAATTDGVVSVRPLIETRSIDWVPHHERHGKLWHQLPLWFLGNFQYFSIPVGFIGPSLGLSLGWTIVAGATGIVVGTLFMAFHASQGPHMGLPQMIQSRAQFGYRGVLIPLLATLFTYVAFNVADQVLVGVGLNGAFGWDENLVAVAVASAAAVLAIFGHDWLHRVFRVLLVVSLPLMVVVTIGILLGKGGGTASGAPGSFGWVAFMAQLSAAAAYNITYAPYVSDYSRYLPAKTKPMAVIASVFIGASASAIWLIALGAWLAIRLGASDGLAGLQQVGNNVLSHLGDVVALSSALALVATMAMNAYGGMLTVLTTIDSFRPITPTRTARVVTVIGLTATWFWVGTSISADAVNTVFVTLTLMLYLLVPWTATNLVDYFLVRRGRYVITELFRPHGIYGTWSWQGLSAYAVGLCAEIPFMVIPELGPIHFTGPLAHTINGVDIAWLVGLLVAGVAYWLFTCSIDLRAQSTAGSTESTHPATESV
ncbi:purine-cytosine permease family protein [Mycobacteroides abscessus]|uniref:purine-cytosine permease family protein n=1 Tax=Mycobacteroides abscessus TaxID=36809 RepID=UPI0009A5D797|nr:cytosine permease [Mycobacteroides abscessus]SKR63112.1 purine-cytosine permease-like transporter [Mycobacteroides abscessus subsp. massiliense]SKX59813.1 purine-cytosine permease-like transporter [Mycobacteroides abscessus subsp. massiliense]SLH02951.1 purine-cytosine permease-like transporter [Mycobacteroides abscessus subsp. massiliense]SLI42481.1 purine-cytosine permease-like transporter [Mycobacteroides abscessus subsp. massiliense]